MVQVLAQAPGRRRVQPKSAARLKAGLFSGPPSFLLNAAAHVDLAHVAASTLTGGVYGALDSSTLGVIFPNTAGQGWVFSAAPITGTEHTILVVANPRAQGSQRNCAVCQRTGAGPFAQVAFNAVAGSLGAIDISSGAFSYQSYDGVNNDGAYITGVANGSNRAFLVSRRGTSYVFSVDGATQTPTVNFSSNASAPTTGVEFKIGDLASYSGTGYGMQDGIALVLVLPFAITQELANKVTRDVWGAFEGAVPPLPWLAQTVASTQGAMKWLREKVARKKQPRGPVPLDTTNPLSRGLVSFMYPLFPGSSLQAIYDAAIGRTTPINTTLNNSTFIGTKDGVAISNSSGDGKFEFSELLFGGGPQTFTRLAIVFPYSLGTYKCISYSNAGFNGGAEWRVTTSGEMELLKGWVASIGTSSGAGIVANKTHVLAVSYDSPNAAFYCNGVPCGTASSAQAFATDTARLVLMGAGGSINDPMFGYITLHVIWNRALSPSEVAAISKNPWQVLKPEFVPYAYSASALNTYLQALTATALSVVATISKARALLRTVSASSTVSATRSRRMSFVRSASSALSATKSRALSFTRSASSALSATVSKIRALKRTITSTAVSLAATLTKTKAVTQAVSTTGSLSAALVRQFGRVRSATASMTATRILVLQRIRLASSTVTATLSRIRALKRTITATAMTISATLSRVRSLMLTVSASAALSASRSRVVNLIRSASAGTTASMVRVRVTLRTITASVSLAATRVRRLGRIRSATAGSSATLSKLRTLGKTITASVSTSATIRRSVKLIVSGAQHITALVSRGTRGIIDITVGVTIQPTLARIRALKRTVTAITTWAATVRKAVRMTRTAVVAVVATRLRRFPYHVTTAVTTVVARIQPARVRVLTATTTLVATITTTLAQIGRLFARIAIRPAVGALRSLKAAVSGKPRIDDDH